MIFEIVYNAAVTVTGDQSTANEIAKRVVQKLADNDVRIVTVKRSTSRPFVFDNEDDANEAADNGRNTGGKSYR